MSGITEPPWRSRVYLATSKVRDQSTELFQSMHQAGPLYPQLLTYRCGAANRRFGPKTRHASAVYQLVRPQSRHLLGEGAQELPGVGRPDAPDHAGREVLLDAVGRGRGRCAQEPRLELLAVCPIVDPFA